MIKYFVMIKWSCNKVQVYILAINVKTVLIYFVFWLTGTFWMGKKIVGKAALGPYVWYFPPSHFSLDMLQSWNWDLWVY